VSTCIVPAQISPEADVRLIPLPAVARMLGVSEKTVARMDRAGKIPAPIRPAGRALRWDLVELAAWLNWRIRTGNLLSRAEWETVRNSANVAV